MVARAQGTSLIFHFVAYRYRGAAAARQRRRTRPASGHRYPHPLPRAAGTQGGRKGGGEGEKESVEKKGRQIYICIYRAEEGRRCSIPGARSWCTLLHRKTERSRGDSFFTFPPPLPRKQGRSFREYNPCYRLPLREKRRLPCTSIRWLHR